MKNVPGFMENMDELNNWLLYTIEDLQDPSFPHSFGLFVLFDCLLLTRGVVGVQL